MKTRKGIVFTIMLCMILNLCGIATTAMTARADEGSPAAGIVSTVLTSEKDQVTAVVSIVENSGATSGRIELVYDPEVMTLESTETFDRWLLEDVNPDYTDETTTNLKRISFAFADEDAFEEGGEILKAVFKVKDAQNGQIVSVGTQIKELYKGEDQVDPGQLGGEVITKVVVANASYFKTTVTSEGDKVTVTVDFIGNQGVTNGRLSVWYDETVMTLLSAESYGMWLLEDINTAYAKDGNQTAVSFAFADADPVNKNGKVLTLVFQVKNATNGQVVEVTTEVNELYQGELTVPDLDKEKGSTTLVIGSSGGETGGGETGGESGGSETGGGNDGDNTGGGESGGSGDAGSGTGSSKDLTTDEKSPKTFDTTVDAVVSAVKDAPKAAKSVAVAVGHAAANNWALLAGLSAAAIFALVIGILSYRKSKED